MNSLLPWLVSAIALLLVWQLWHRIRLSLAKHPSLAGHPRIAKRMARRLRGRTIGDERFFCIDGAADGVAARRRAAFERLSAHFRERSPTSRATLERLRDGVSDLQFTSRYQVPFPFSRKARESLRAGVLVKASSQGEVVDLDGNRFIDLTGAYGVNVFGIDRYKRWIEEGASRVRELGPVLGPYHPVIEANVERLRVLSGLDEVSFHMSGTESVMQAVRLARYHTGRSHIVRFAGAYHGWWDDVQPGIGNPAAAGKVYTLAEMSEVTLRVLRKRRDIACVLVNPLQSLHPNRNAPGDGSLVIRRTDARVSRSDYSGWLQQLREVCDERGIVLILDEIFTGFRLARRGAQEYFGVRADLVTYGKTLGGGLPIGVLCGRSPLMKRFREGRPADICFARGTFNSHPYVLGSMGAFLDWFESESGRSPYDGLDERWSSRASAMNARFERAGLPFRISNLSSIFTTVFPEPSRYHWMLQYYLNAEGLLLPWVGTGRFIFPVDARSDLVDEVLERLVSAGTTMRDDGWWDMKSDLGAVRRQLFMETVFGRT